MSKSLGEIFGDFTALAKAGWTPSQVKEILEIINTSPEITNGTTKVEQGEDGKVEIKKEEPKSAEEKEPEKKEPEEEKSDLEKLADLLK